MTVSANKLANLIQKPIQIIMDKMNYLTISTKQINFIEIIGSIATSHFQLIYENNLIAVEPYPV